MSTPLLQPNQHDFRVAILCALPLEAGMVKLVFDQNWTDHGFNIRQREDDRNSYTVGLIGRHNIVLVHMAGAGSTGATTAAHGLRATFPRIDVVFVVGICGATPGKAPQEIFLGDCILSTALIQYDFGRQYPGQFQRKTNVEDSLGRARPEIRGLLAKLQALGTPQAIETRLALHLQVLQERITIPIYPGAQNDRLFDPTYLHTHRFKTGNCDKCVEGCKEDCSELGCDAAYLIPRAGLAEYENTQKQRNPRLHFGRYGSANTVLKSGVDRDKYANKDEIIAFEMEAAGVWEEFPTLVVKSACDYADSHKNKQWQDYAAATAAAGLKAVLEHWRAEALSNERGRSLRVQMLRLTSMEVDHSMTAPLPTSAIHEGDRLVRHHYCTGDRLLITRLSGQELDMDSCYINLALVDQSTVTRKEKQKEPTSLEARLQLDASTVGSSMRLIDIFKPRKANNADTTNPRRIFIRGRAGVGKTTLCKKIVYEFLEGRLGDGLFSRLIWIPLRGLKLDQREYEWADILADTFRTSPQAWKQVRQEYAKQFDDTKFLNETLFLFDGLDEISHRWSDESCVLIDTIIRSAPNIIITSRPQGHTFNRSKFDLNLETLGFTLRQVSTYIKNCIANTASITKLENLVAQKPLIRGLLRIPIQLDAFCYVADTEAGSDLLNMKHSMTMTTIYQSILTELCRKDLKRLGKSKEHSRPPSARIQHDLKTELTLLGEIAFQGLLNNVVEFAPDHWDQLGNHLYTSNKDFEDDFSRTLERLSFLRTSDRGSDYTKQSYHFIHLTFQEFFAARHYAEHWCRNEALNCLQMPGRTQSHTKEPLLFLQEEKYNPRYNIFWRFVAGLTYDRTGTAGFFDQLNKEPVDLLGFMHSRLLMYCASEMVMSRDVQRPPVGRALLRQGLVREYQLTGGGSIGVESEFPEDILCSFLEYDLEIPMDTILHILKRRSTLEQQTVEVVSLKFGPGHMSEISLGAANVLWNHPTNCDQSILVHAFDHLCSAGETPFYYRRGHDPDLPVKAIDILCAALHDGSPKARVFAAQVLAAQSYLSEASIDRLIVAAFDEEHRVRYEAECALKTQSDHFERISNHLVARLADRDASIRCRAVNVLAQPSFLTGEVINHLILLCNDEDLSVRREAVRSLRHQEPLSQKAIDIILAIFGGDEDEELIRIAADVLKDQQYLPQQAIDVLLAALGRNSHVRDAAARVLGYQKHLPQSAIDALLVLLGDNDEVARSTVAKFLGYQQHLPQSAIDALLVLLGDTDDLVRFTVTNVLGEQQHLPQSAIDALLVLLGDSDAVARFAVANVLGEQQHLPQSAIDALLVLLGDNDDLVRCDAAVALRQQHCLWNEISNAMLPILRKHDMNVQRNALNALGVQSNLSQEVLNTMITIYNEKPDIRSSILSAIPKLSATSPGIMSLILSARTDEDFSIYSPARDMLDDIALPAEAVSALVRAVQCGDLDAAGLLASQSYLNGATIVTILTMLGECDRFDNPDDLHAIYSDLQDCEQFYLTIGQLHHRDWVKVWPIWLMVAEAFDMSCYKLQGNLYLWSNGIRYEISADLVQVSRILRVISGVSEDAFMHDACSVSGSDTEDMYDEQPATKFLRLSEE